MLQFIIDGGPPALILLVFGTVLLLFSGLYARQPAENRRRFVGGLSTAIAWIMVGGFASGVRLTLNGCARMPEEMRAELPQIAMAGVAESLGVVVLGTGFLTLAWFLMAIGLRRTDAP